MSAIKRGIFKMDGLPDDDGPGSTSGGGGGGGAGTSGSGAGALLAAAAAAAAGGSSPPPPPPPPEGPHRFTKRVVLRALLRTARDIAQVGSTIGSLGV